MLNKIVSVIKNLNRTNYILDEIISQNQNDAKNLKVNLGQIQSILNSNKTSISDLSEVEFQVFSQFGDDGIIQFIVNKTQIANKTFIEFGVENYKESNTRFLLVNNKWSGLIIDGASSNIEYIKKDFLFSHFDLHARKAFITVENINELISSFIDIGYSTDIGLLSIDIDGNDYWIWKEISVINPIIVVVEYNSLFGYENPWTIPYHKDFFRLMEDPLFQYWGASIAALCHLGEEKGYDFIGCNSHGNNAYFIRKDRNSIFENLSPSKGYKKALFREYLPDGFRVLTFEERLNLIKGKPVLNVIKGSIEYI